MKTSNSAGLRLFVFVLFLFAAASAIAEVKGWLNWLMEMLGRLTFPNARNGSPVIEDDLVITRYITSNWGGEGAAADRFYAFDKKTGELVWSSTPGTIPPKNQTFARPLFTWRG